MQKKLLTIKEMNRYLEMLNGWAKMTKKERKIAVARATNTSNNGKQLGVDLSVLHACIDLKESLLKK